MSIETATKELAMPVYGIRGEVDTYAALPPQEKVGIPKSAIRAHWDLRAMRPGVQSVMSARHPVEVNERESEVFVRAVLDFVRPYAQGGRVFELGVGIGRITKGLAAMAREVVGVDISPNMIRRAHENLRGAPNVLVGVGTAESVYAPPQSFDLAMESIVLMHILNPAEFRATIAKMKELGKRVVLVENVTNPRALVSKYTLLRTEEEYKALLQPYELKKRRTVVCAGDTLTMMLFEEPAQKNGRVI